MKALCGPKSTTTSFPYVRKYGLPSCQYNMCVVSMPIPSQCFFYQQTTKYQLLEIPYGAEWTLILDSGKKIFPTRIKPRQLPTVLVQNCMAYTTWPWDVTVYYISRKVALSSLHHCQLNLTMILVCQKIQ